MENQEESEDKELEEAIDSLNSFSNKVNNRIEPYRRPIIYLSIIMLLLFVGFVGFSIGAFKVCSQVVGGLDNKFFCHLDYFPDGVPKNYTNNKIQPALFPVIYNASY